MGSIGVTTERQRLRKGKDSQSYVGRGLIRGRRGVRSGCSGVIIR